jgi:aryl-alcohol dehydrogenase-like predicted oxidoreductase
MMKDSQDPGAEHPQREIPEDIAQYAKEHGIRFDLWSPVVHKMLRLRMQMGWGNEKTRPDDSMYWRHWQE